MITQLIQAGPQGLQRQLMKSDLNETLLLIGAILFWAAVLPIASAFLALAVLWDRIGVSLRRGQLIPWGGVLSQFPGRRVQDTDRSKSLRMQLHRR